MDRFTTDLFARLRAISTFLPVLLKDFYKVGHKFQYVKGTTKVYSNFTPRGTRRDPKPDGVIWTGLQYFVLEYLLRQFEENFFLRDRDEVVKEYKRVVDACLGPGTDVSHIGELHELGYLPLHVKGLDEGTLVPYRVPTMTIYNTEDRFFWLVNMLETILSSVLWPSTTSATTAFGYLKTFHEFARKTGADPAFVPWQGHNFSMRGMMGVEAQCLTDFGHLASGFTGTDTIPGILFAETFYGANASLELVGGSVPATEHSVMCMGLKDGEFETFKRLITETYPAGIVSIVSDTWDLWKVLTEYLPRLKAEILAREGKVVIRPDSGDPVKILCGDPDANVQHPAYWGVIRNLDLIFGHTMTVEGYKVLDPHIGAIYGDSITPDRQREILERLAAMGYASSNIVLGIGSFTYQCVTRDTDGWAMKATYGEIDGKGRSISKNPITDNGVKKSASGLLNVQDHNGVLVCNEECTWDEESDGLLKTRFLNGNVLNLTTLKEIRTKVATYL